MDAREALNHYAGDYHDALHDGDREDAAPRAFAALRAVLDVCAKADADPYEEMRGLATTEDIRDAIARELGVE